MRYNYFLSCVFCLLGVSSLWGQQSEHKNSPYLFDEFKDATVYLKQGAPVKEKMNYNLVVESFCFVRDGEVFQVSTPEDIVAIEIGDRTFYQDKEGGIEVLPTTPILYVQYKVTARVGAPKGAYGTSSETSSVKAYSHFHADASTYTLETSGVEITKRFNIYWIEKGEKKKQFKTFKQFVKLYPKQYTKAIDEYIKENQVEFNDVDMMVKLSLFAENLQESH